jgi:hypothetical protein
VPDLLVPLHSLYWLTSNLATVQPLVVAIDDVHWADVVSWRCVPCHRLEELPVLVVVAS